MNCMTYFLLLILFSSVNLKKVSVYVHPYSPDITRCDFINGEDTNVNCYGKSLMEIPNNLSRYLSQFSITQSGIKHITKSSFDRYREEMRDVTLSDLPYLRVIEDGTFSDMPKLRTLYITHAPQIMFLHGLLKGVTSHNFYSLRIVWTKLTEIPDLYDLSINNNTLFLLDLDHNNIQHIQANAIKVIAQQVQMHHNPQLRTLGINAFSGIKSLWSLGSENLTSSDYLLRSRMFGAIHPIKGKALGREEGRVINTMKNDDFNEDDGFFHLVTKVNDTEANNQCGNIVIRIPEVECLPDPDALNPCEDIMGMSWLRISVWCVVVLALLGNLAVMIVFLFGPTEINVARFLICNLAFADFCMGLYLLLIASMDFHSVGEYFNFAYNWQYGIGCQIAGFLTVFSSHLSIYTLTIITLERWFAITYAIHLTKRITIKCAMYILLGGWVYSFIIAILPVVGISNYSSTSICLPMESKEVVDKIYLYTVIFINGAAFALIVFCYVQIYLSLGYETRRASTKGEMTIAKKMSLLVLVDFATVAPVAFFGLTALAGYPLIGVTKSKILLVFFYPLNACANPYLYAVMTAQYRQDFLKLVSRCKNCNRHIEPHKTDSVPLSISNHTHKNGYCATHG
ncbi:lutropin-choriogonadotropic hormone receptor-like isoform X4 [Diabrotica virgifera virgifera]|uniref:G-protein coupled receptors family 1 profile domain-containing protein n=1 Tax=Diabrotica virgifera virgifera TaxID=50390 RepID=A0ABM5K6U2_DIAVI|nr:lutropin-choriogonadotropic hormone receptor-like isoform X4 [Diabrotica virgifera virgifera]